MIRILCFGDSNVWGLNTGRTRTRLTERFPKVLQKLLRQDYEVIEEGLYSRTISSDDTRPNREGRNGSKYLIPCLDSHDPLDLVVLMIGTAELKEMFNKTPEEVGELLEEHMVKVVLNRKSILKEKKPKVLIIAPPVIDETTEWASTRYLGGTEKSKKISEIFSKIAEKNSCLFLDASQLETWTDGVHITKESHKKLAAMIVEKIRSIE
ncbi:MAG: GDSL-type esterase/lipase family protein [archaeon]